ncbi:carboxypeptidase-like regulatory domain-containing protein [Flavobacterium sp. 3HN19-14]|uniref:carboxypeptidase-like regulatory domain-containing protein n=1 Tax=Flavobacterium sp. 3HN19-14 TaxID=3448133 RepID=UPI003EE1B58B
MSAQLSGIVTDSISGKPVSFATIAVEDEKQGATAEEDGKFTIEENVKDKTLIVSALGFETKKIASVNAVSIQLKPVVYELNEVAINNPNNQENNVIGAFEKHQYIQPGWSWPTLFAKKFPYESAYEQTPFIKNAIIYTDNSHRKATIKIRVFGVDAAGFPGEDLINEDIIITVKRGERKTIVDLTKYKLQVPETGIFVAFEWMLIESNKYNDYYKSEGKRHDVIRYEPTVLGNRTKTRNAYFREGGGKWYERPLMTGDGNVVGSFEPAINLTLTD